MLPRVASVLRLGLLCVAGVAAIASATAPKVHQFAKDQTIRVGYDSAWGAILDVFAENNIPIATMEKDSGIIVSDWMGTQGGDSIRDCGSPGIASVRRDQGKFNVRVRRVDGGVRVTVNARFTQQRFLDDIVVDVECQSRGKIEALVLSAAANAGPELPSGGSTVTTGGGSTALPRATAKEQEGKTRADGTEGNSCYGNGTCNDGLTCLDDVCVDPSAPASGTDGGACYGNGTCNTNLVCNPNTRLCSSKAQDGSDGGACYGNGTCDDGLACEESLKHCVPVAAEPVVPVPKQTKPVPAALAPVPSTSTSVARLPVRDEVTATETDSKSWLTFRKKLALGLGAVSLIGAGGGTYLGIDAISHRGDAEDAIANCETSPSFCNAQGISLYEEARSSADRANIFWGIAITTGVAGGWLWFTDKPSGPEKESASASLAPTITSEHLGATVQGVF